MPVGAVVPNEAAPHHLVGSGINNLKILVVDDHDIIRLGFKDLLTAKPGWEVCAEAKTGRETVTLAVQLKPEVTITEISMPTLIGPVAARHIHQILPKTGILTLT